MLKIIEDQDVDSVIPDKRKILGESCKYCGQKAKKCEIFYANLKSCGICTPLYFVNRMMNMNIIHDLLIACYLDESVSLYKVVKEFNLNKNTVKSITKRFTDSQENGFRTMFGEKNGYNGQWNEQTDTTKTSIDFDEIEEALKMLISIVREIRGSDKYFPRSFKKKQQELKKDS